MITYNKNAEWASVKVNGIEGYMASPYLLTQADFNLLNGVWGDTDSRMCISSSKCRLAILDFIRIISWRAVPQVGRFIQKQRAEAQYSVLSSTLR